MRISSDTKDLLYMISGAAALSFTVVAGVASVLSLTTMGF
jgi:hypothetical protein